MVAAELLRLYGTAAHLAPLQALRPALRPRKALRDWRLEVDRAIATIAVRAAGTCPCGVDATHGAPLRTSAMQIDRERVDREAYSVRYHTTCLACGQRWTVIEQHGYHYPT